MRSRVKAYSKDVNDGLYDRHRSMDASSMDDMLVSAIKAKAIIIDSL